MTDSTADQLKVNFAIVGVQKAATSTLHTMLTAHPEIAHGTRKELHYFDDERLDWRNPDYRRLFAPRRDPREHALGDATPSYLWWPGALERMHHYRPSMRLIATFRDPIERAFSQWSMESKRRETYPTFSDAIIQLGDLSVMQTFPPGLMPTDLRQRAMVVRGLYGAQLRRGLAIFDRSQWLLLPFRRVVGEHQVVLDEIADHIGVSPWRVHPPLRTNPTPRDQAGPPPTAYDMLRLTEIYADDLRDFSELSGIDVSDWPTARVARGVLDPAELANTLARKVGLASAD